MKLILLSVCMLNILAGCAANQKLDISGGEITPPANTVEPTLVSSDTVIRISYCPTMEEDLPILDVEGHTIEVFPYPSAAQALQAIYTGEVHAALIGRKPYAAEMRRDFVVLQLRDGATLINAKQRTIPFEELVSLHIHTKLAIQKVIGLFPEGTQITYHPERIPVDLLDQNSAVLMDWAEVPGDYQLLIPVNEQGEKIPHFRTPFYVYPSSNAERFQALIADIPVS